VVGFRSYVFAALAAVCGEATLVDVAESGDHGTLYVTTPEHETLATIKYREVRPGGSLTNADRRPALQIRIAVYPDHSRQEDYTTIEPADRDRLLAQVDILRDACRQRLAGGGMSTGTPSPS